MNWKEAQSFKLEVLIAEAPGGSLCACLFYQKERVEYLESDYHSLDDPKSRTIRGLGIGGRGTLYLAIRHQDVFAISVAMSPESTSALSRIIGISKNALVALKNTPKTGKPTQSSISPSSSKTRNTSSTADENGEVMIVIT
jgi:enterochelin esterase-like enzyme